jgi:hypothetical protein
VRRGITRRILDWFVGHRLVISGRIPSGVILGAAIVFRHGFASIHIIRAAPVKIRVKLLHSLPNIIEIHVIKEIRIVDTLLSH